MHFPDRFRSCHVVACVCAIGFLLLSGPVGNAQNATPVPLPVGQLIDIGGWKLHLNCSGSGQEGVPTVVFEAGAGGTSFDWYFVQSEVSQFTRACSYDRAGTAWSDVGPHPRTVRQMAYELHTLLSRAGIPGPYVLVGHSFGGIIVRNFQVQFPRDVAGMVLVDVASDDTRLVHFEKLVRMREITSGRAIPPVRTTITDADRETPPSSRALVPFTGPPPPSPSGLRHVYPADVARLREWALQRREVGTQPGDGDYTGQEFAELYEARRSRPHVLDDMPLIVLIARKRQVAANLRPEWRVPNEEINQEEEDLARMSSKGKFIYAENSTHVIANDEPEVVTQAIAAVVEATISNQATRTSVAR